MSLASSFENILYSNKYIHLISHWFNSNDFGYVLQGFIKGFCIYSFPISLLKRKINSKIIKRSLAIGIFSCSIRFFNLLLKNYKGKYYCDKLSNYFYLTNEEQKKKFRISLSTCIGIILATNIDKSLINSIFVLWCLIRSLPFILPSFPFASTFIMCISATFIGSTWVKRPNEIDSSYKRFLTSQAGKPKYVFEFLQDDIPFSLMCYINHPNQTCLQHSIIYAIQSFFRGLKLYIPFHVFLFVFSKYGSLSSLLLNILRSSTFMCLYCSGCWVITCLLFGKYLFSKQSPLTYNALLLRLWVGGLAVLIEKPGRQRELAQYCATYAVDTQYKHLLVKSYIKPNHFIGTLILCFSWIILIWNYKKQPRFVTNWLLGLNN